MNIKKIVVSLGLSKKLWQAGLKVNSFFYWAMYGNEKIGMETFWHPEPKDVVNKRTLGIYLYPAYTNTELLKWLKKNKPEITEFGQLLFRYDKKWIVCENYLHSKDFSASTPQDALAKLVLWVLEEK